MAIASIGYVAMEAKDPAGWGKFAETILGAKAIPGSGGETLIRLDERSWRIAVHPGEDGRLRGLGWELQTKSDLDDALARLKSAGVQVRAGSKQECAERRVEACAFLTDPTGMPLELFYGQRVQATPFISPLGLSRLTLGHIVLGAPDLAAAERFYTDVLGFRVSDYIDFERAGRTISLAFLHALDGRHHSVAFAGGVSGINHLMIEAPSIDEVGRAYDRCRKANVPIRASLGRHSNDLMFSFYAFTPNGVAVEFGCDGIHVDDSTWKVTRLETTSLWGHQPVA